MDNARAKLEIKNSVNVLRYWVENGDAEVGRYIWDIVKELTKAITLKFKFGK